MAGPPAFAQASPRQSTRVPAPASIFPAAREAPFVLFDRHGRALMCNEPAPGDDDSAVYLSPRDLHGLHAYLLRHLHAITTSQTVPPADAAWAVHHALLYEASETFASFRERMSLARLTAVLREACAFQLAHAGTFPFLDVIFSAAYSLATHAVDTALYASALAAADGVDDAETLFAIAAGGLFADVAKLELPVQVLMRNGPLTDEEWRQMREHPRRSAEMMRQAGMVVATALRGVLSHHERWDGAGYPECLAGGQIPYEARCMAIGDTYGAMTVDRGFRARLDPFDALMEMSARPPGQFDPRLLRSFVMLLGTERDTTSPPDRAAAAR